MYNLLLVLWLREMAFLNKISNADEQCVNKKVEYLTTSPPHTDY